MTPSRKPDHISAGVCDPSHNLDVITSPDTRITIIISPVSGACILRERIITRAVSAPAPVE